MELPSRGVWFCSTWVSPLWSICYFQETPQPERVWVSTRDESSHWQLLSSVYPWQYSILCWSWRASHVHSSPMRHSRCLYLNIEIIIMVTYSYLFEIWFIITSWAWACMEFWYMVRSDIILSICVRLLTPSTLFLKYYLMLRLFLIGLSRLLMSSNIEVSLF